jgi:TonB family protein
MPETTVAAKPIEPAKHDASPGPARGGPVTSHVPRALFVVLTRADDLLEQIGRLLDESSEVRHAEHEEEARRCMDPRHATVMLLDAREHADPGPVVERLHSSDGTNVIVVFAPANAVADVARAIRGSAAFAVLPIPLESEKTAAVLHGAGEEALARRALLTPAAEAPVARAAPSAPQRSPESAPERPVVVPKPVAVADDIPFASESVAAPAAGGARPRAGGIPRSALLAAAGLLVAAGAAWFYLRDGASPAPEPVAAVAPATSVTDAQQAPATTEAASLPERELSTEPREELLDRARVAFQERRYTDPEGDNALYYYRSVLLQDPEDGEAREGLLRIASVLEDRLEDALAAQRTEDAARTLAQLRSIRPDDAALAATELRITEARIGAALARGENAQAAALVREAELSGAAPEQLAPLREQVARADAAQRGAQLARLVSARIRDGKLVAPPGDNAKHYLGQLQKLPNGKRLGAEVSDELAVAFADRARRAAAQGQADEADQWLTEARALGYEPERAAASTVTAPTASSPAAMAPPPPTESPSKARQPSPVAEPPGREPSRPDVRAELQASNRAPLAAESEVSAADFKRTRFVPPVYPPKALSRGQEGEVRVRITVDTAGRVAAAQVVSATPPDVFDQAAVDAVRKWRFEPVMRDGRPIEASIATTIRFRPDDAQR